MKSTDPPKPVADKRLKPLALLEKGLDLWHPSANVLEMLECALGMNTDVQEKLAGVMTTADTLKMTAGARVTSDAPGTTADTLVMSSDIQGTIADILARPADRLARQHCSPAV